jgi:hypothetical protein
MSELPAQISHVYPIDRFLHANEARLTADLSPSSALSTTRIIGAIA